MKSLKKLLLIKFYVRILKKNWQKKLSKKKNDNVFSRMTFQKETIAETLKNIDGWISMIKQLMIRVLNANISLEVPLQLYLERTDLWSDRVNNTDLQTFQIDEDILLQHTYVEDEGAIP